eukprot:TRINITY_DN3059_c0_g1_i1.p1 TRINITY_DN3059_c0_g1~~TRINITY_DN3059_c0_g1_i1.p1  ORF type:complete len:817 (-),score=148.71 TRINITY_DN3059_c0_g1_i1:391-2841(-)
MYRRQAYQCGGCLTFAGVAMIVIGVVISALILAAIDAAVEEAVVIDSPTHPNYDNWLRTNDGGDPLYRQDFYLFNITNIEQVVAGAQPIVREVGPYSYEKVVQKLDVTFAKDEKSVEYRDWVTYHPLKDSAHDDSDVIYQMSLPYLATVYARVGGMRLTEAGLVASVFAGFLNKTFVGLTTDFQKKIYYGSLPTVVGQWKAMAQGYSFGGAEANFLYAFAASETSVNLGTQCTTLTGHPVVCPYLGSHYWQLMTMPCTYPATSTDLCRDVAGISNATAKDLFDSSKSYSFTHPTLFSSWVSALQGDTNAKVLLQRIFSLNTVNMNRVLNWLGSFMQNYMNQFHTTFNPAWIAQGYTNENDVGYMQFGSLVPLSGASLYELGQAPLPAEYYAWSKLVDGSSRPSWNVAKTRKIVDGEGVPSPGFRNPVGVITFFQLLATNPTAVPAYFGFDDLTEALVFKSYIDFIISKTLLPVCENFGCLWKRTTVRDYLFGTQPDPLLTLLGQSVTSVGLFSNYTTPEKRRTLPGQKFFTGKDDLELVQHIDHYNGQPYLIRSDGTPIWAEKIKVKGSSPTQQKPKYTSSKINVFSTTLTRDVDLTYSKEQTIHGLKTRRYDLEGFTLASSAKNPDNAKYYMNYDGIHNYTTMEFMPGLYGLPAYLSLPHMYHADPLISGQVKLMTKEGNTINGMQPDPTRHTAYICVDELTGASFQAYLGSQFVSMIGPEKDAVFNAIYKGRVSSAPLPITWAAESSTLTEDQADAYKSVVVSAQESSKVVLIVLVTLGSVSLFAGLVMVFYGFKFARDAPMAKDVDMDSFNPR